MEVSDDGKGMPEGILENSPRGVRARGLGIEGMRERVRIMGGRLEIISGEKGTTVRAVVPRPGETS